jgi:hypothetical protein
LPAAVQEQPQEQEPDGDAATAASPDRRLLPIYDSLESDWFKRGGTSLRADSSPADAPWTSPADEGFRMARAAAAPATGDTTAVGLPRRVPAANLIPGSVGGWQQTQQPGQAESRQPRAARARSADEMRERLANLQRGAREGRVAAPWDYGADED